MEKLGRERRTIHRPIKQPVIYIYIVDYRFSQTEKIVSICPRASASEQLYCNLIQWLHKTGWSNSCWPLVVVPFVLLTTVSILGTITEPNIKLCRIRTTRISSLNRFCDKMNEHRSQNVIAPRHRRGNRSRPTARFVHLFHFSSFID